MGFPAWVPGEGARLECIANAGHWVSMFELRRGYMHSVNKRTT